MTDGKKSQRPPASPARTSVRPPADPNAAAALGQDLLTQLQHDFSTNAQAQQKAQQKASNDALIGLLQRDFVDKRAQKQAEAAHLANALLNKVARDFGTIPPPPQQQSVTKESDEQLEAAAAQTTPLSAEELADLDAMTAPTGFWGKLFARFGKKRPAGG